MRHAPRQLPTDRGRDEGDDPESPGQAEVIGQPVLGEQNGRPAEKLRPSGRRDQMRGEPVERGRMARMTQQRHRRDGHRQKSRIGQRDGKRNGEETRARAVELDHRELSRQRPAGRGRDQAEGEGHSALADERAEADEARPQDDPGHAEPLADAEADAAAGGRDRLRRRILRGHGTGSHASR